MQKAKPIVFSMEMIKAILDGRKTQTRRVIRPSKNQATVDLDKPPWKAGDRLWVREAWGTEFDLRKVKPSYLPKNTKIFYRADRQDQIGLFQWRPSIYMPCWASRLTLEILKIHAEKVQDIDNHNSWAEGIPEFGQWMVNEGELETNSDDSGIQSTKNGAMVGM